MAVLGEKKVTELTLPSGGVVQVNTAVTMNDLAGSEDYANMVEKSAYGLSKLIVGWDFTTPEGAAAPITFENVKLLGVPDFGFLNQWFEEKLGAVKAGLPDEVKKN